MAAKRLLFGTAGIPLSARGKGNPGGIERCAQLGLGCMELEYVYGVRVTAAQAAAVREAAAAFGIALSAHAPYYINLNSKEPEKVDASMTRILESARKVAASGGDRVVFHAAFFGGDAPDAVFKKVKKRLAEIRRTLRTEKLDRVALLPELTGKPSQFGSLDELIRLSLDVEGVRPCIDFSHLYARDAGKINSYDGFCRVLERLGSELGGGALEDLHAHMSGIEFTPKGEKKHLPARESGLKYAEVLKSLRRFGVSGRLICESPNREEDAVMFQKRYRRLRGESVKNKKPRK